MKEEEHSEVAGRMIEEEVQDIFTSSGITISLYVVKITSDVNDYVQKACFQMYLL